MRIVRLGAALAALALLAIPSLASAQSQTAVTGTAIYLERILPPPGSQVTVQLLDVSRADAAATLIAEQVIDTNGTGPPYAFTLPYDPAQIQDNLSYAVRATLRDGDQLLFTSTTSYPVITRGNPTSDIEIRMERVSGDAGTGSATATPDPAATAAPAATPAPTTTTPSTLPATGEPGAGLGPLLVLAALSLLGGLALGLRRRA